MRNPETVQTMVPQRRVYIGREATLSERLPTFASARFRHLLKIGQPINNTFVSVNLSNRLQSLRQVETFRKLLMMSNFDCFASGVNASLNQCFASSLKYTFDRFK